MGKLTNQYGEFDIYINKLVTNEDILNLFETKIKPLSSSVIDFYQSGVYAFAVIHGQNNTGIVLRWNNKSEVELVYAKTNAWDHVQRMKEALENEAAKKEDVGL